MRAGAGSLAMPVENIGLIHALQYWPVSRDRWPLIHSCIAAPQFGAAGNAPVPAALGTSGY